MVPVHVFLIFGLSYGGVVRRPPKKVGSVTTNNHSAPDSNQIDRYVREIRRDSKNSMLSNGPTKTGDPCILGDSNRGKRFSGERHDWKKGLLWNIGNLLQNIAELLGDKSKTTVEINKHKKAPFFDDTPFDGVDVDEKMELRTILPLYR
ncbi:hypothetical protein V3C99_003506 [Haemonchus contortus]